MHVCVCVACCVCVCCRCVFGLGFGSGYSGATYIVRPALSLTNIIPFFAFFFCFLFSFCSFSLLLLCCFAFFASPKSANTLLPSQIRRRPPNRTPTEPNRRGPIIINNNFRQLGPRAPHRQYQRAKTKAKNVRHGAGRVE